MSQPGVPLRILGRAIGTLSADAAEPGPCPADMPSTAPAGGRQRPAPPIILRLYRRIPEPVMLNDIKKDAQTRMAKSVESLRHNLVKVRTGRASTGLVDSIKVSAYGSDVPLSQVASVSVSDARSLVITPWDKGMVGAVEKAILPDPA